MSLCGSFRPTFRTARRGLWSRLCGLLLAAFGVFCALGRGTPPAQSTVEVLFEALPMLGAAIRQQGYVVTVAQDNPATLKLADRRRLKVLARDRNAPHKHVWRAEIVLLSADAVGTNEIMRRTGKSKTCVWRWQERFMQEGYDVCCATRRVPRVSSRWDRASPSVS